MPDGFKYDLKSTVRFRASGEVGEVVASAHYATMENQYLVRYKTAGDRMVNEWWGESFLDQINTEPI